MLQPEDPGHIQFRGLLRVVGPLMIGIGGFLTLIGMVSFFSGFGSSMEFGRMPGPPKFFWCAFVGMPIAGIGIMITKFAFMGAGVRYMANEVAPVAKDTINYMAEETKETMVNVSNYVTEGTKGAKSEMAHDVAAAIAQGLRDGAVAEGPQATRHCPKCQAENEATANFCKGCGTPLGKTLPCASCGGKNDPDAKYCNCCGTPLA